MDMDIKIADLNWAMHSNCEAAHPHPLHPTKYSSAMIMKNVRIQHQQLFTHTVIHLCFDFCVPTFEESSTHFM